MPKILIVDDSKFMRDVLKDILTRNGYSDVEESDNGEDAIKKYDSLKPDLVLLDLIMPEKDGLSVLSDIMPKGAKVIVVSMVSMEKIIKEVEGHGVEKYIVKTSGKLSKPFEESEVVEAIKKAIG